MKRTYSQIDMEELRKIARWRVVAGISVDVIAGKLRRHRSTIFRELKRNAFKDEQYPDLDGYYCVTANEMAPRASSQAAQARAVLAAAPVGRRPHSAWPVAATDCRPAAAGA